MLAPLPIEFNQTLLFHFLSGHHQERSRKGTPVREGEVELGGGGVELGGPFFMFKSEKESCYLLTDIRIWTPLPLGIQASLPAR